MVQPRRDASRRLFDVAEQQQGLFTTKKAKAAGFAENTHPYHVQAGNWIRERRGIYRLALFPSPERPDLVQWSLWSRNRKEEIEGVYSHQTALSLHELSDLNPAKLHMTVPQNFRRNSEIPGILVLHYYDLPRSDILIGPGFKYTRPLRTILDLIDAGASEEMTFALFMSAAHCLPTSLQAWASWVRPPASSSPLALFARGSLLWTLRFFSQAWTLRQRACL